MWQIFIGGGWGGVGKMRQKIWTHVITMLLKVVKNLKSMFLKLFELNTKRWQLGKSPHGRLQWLLILL